MTFSKQLFPLLLLFHFPLRHASNPNKCSTSLSEPLTCQRFGVPIQFPFCDHSGFNLYCTNHSNPLLELPMLGSFLVDAIDYEKQQIYINDPENCLVERLLTFNLSGSPFFPRFNIRYTFLTCPIEVIKPSWSPRIYCLSNSTSYFFATSNFALAQSMLPSCQIVKRVSVPAKSPIEEINFSSNVNYHSLLLEWDSPNCKSCEKRNLRCGFKNNASLKVKCFGAKKSGHLSREVLALIICVFIIGAITVTCIVIRIYNSERFVSMRRRNAEIAARTTTQQSRDFMVPWGLDQTTIDSYKKVELGESKRVPGTNGIVCPICLSEYASKEIVRFIPDCDHCFHVECIDPWLKIHGSCPVCRNSHA